MRDEEDYEEKARREYVWRRKCEIFNEIENLWLDFLEVLDYPNMTFVEYVCQEHDPPLTKGSAGYVIWVWKFVRSLSPMHQN
jgi:hypothetical protein